VDPALVADGAAERCADHPPQDLDVLAHLGDGTVGLETLEAPVDVHVARPHAEHEPPAGQLVEIHRAQPGEERRSAVRVEDVRPQRDAAGRRRDRRQRHEAAAVRLDAIDGVQSLGLGRLRGLDHLAQRHAASDQQKSVTHRRISLSWVGGHRRAIDVAASTCIERSQHRRTCAAFP
jgi:hypothetical protein